MDDLSLLNPHWLKNVACLKVMEVTACSSHSGAVFFDFSLEASQSNVQEQFPVFDTSSDWY